MVKEVVCESFNLVWWWRWCVFWVY